MKCGIIVFKRKKFINLFQKLQNGLKKDLINDKNDDIIKRISYRFYKLSNLQYSIIVSYHLYLSIIFFNISINTFLLILI